ncbi:hypothetical protein [Brachybacterium alimentarium]|uniref:hypothetical protein n=1 Tax=Brachybacterium alimentarium TaxID=47845 RepID=UPI003FCF5DBE
MADGESTTPAPRRRPTYGRPAPTTPGPTDGAPGAADGSYGAGGGAYGAADGAYGPAHGSAGGPYGAAGSPYGAADGASGNSAPQWGSSFGSAAPGSDRSPSADGSVLASGPLPPQPPNSAPPRKRRGLLPLLIGLALLVLIAPITAIGGLVWGFSSLGGDASDGPTVIEGSTGELEMSANQMLILYVPAEDADATTCTAEGTSANAVTTVPTSGEVTFGDGVAYSQTMGVAALEDTTVTITCEGTDAPAYLGPYNLLSVAAPMLIGPIIGIVAGLIGLALTIVGIILLARSRQA